MWLVDKEFVCTRNDTRTGSASDILCEDDVNKDVLYGASSIWNFCEVGLYTENMFCMVHPECETWLSTVNHVSGPLGDADIRHDISIDNESDAEVVLTLNSLTPVSESDSTHGLNTLSTHNGISSTELGLDCIAHPWLSQWHGKFKQTINIIFDRFVI